MNHRQRKAYSLATVFGLLFLISHVSSALAQNYTLNSLFSTNQGLPQLLGTVFAPSINNSGKVAHVRRTNNPFVVEQVIFIHDGTSETPFFNLTTAGYFTNNSVVINDNGAVAVLATPVTSCPGNPLGCLIRINPDQSVTILATANGVGQGGDFAEFSSGPSMNSSGQIAVLARRESDGVNQIIRIDGPGLFTEIFTTTASLINPTWPSINNSGVVAFRAQDISCQPINCLKVFSGTGGGVLNEEGVSPSGGGGGDAPFINNNGLVLAAGSFPALIYTAQGGVVNTLVVGNEDPVFSSGGQASQNDLGHFVFVSAGGGEFGMFTGNDPSQDTVFRSNQTVFGGTPGDFRTALHYINNSGQIAFALAVVDGSGNVTSHIVRADPVPQDTTPPDTSITSSPGALTNSTSAILSFTSTEAGSTFACRLDGSAFTSCVSPQSYSSLTSGSHTFQVRATDAANNTDQTPASFTWIIDITAPDTTITSNPPATTNSTSASFSFTSTEAGSTFACSLDGGAFAACTSPASYNGLAPGNHTFQVRATDTAGNTDPTPASYAWTITTVDTTPPDTLITSSPPALTSSTTASFSFTSTEAGSTFACSLDAARFTACISPVSYSRLKSGAHTFQVRATDTAENTDATPASFGWVVDTAAPNTTITSSPGAVTNSGTASFGFASTESGSTFACRIDGAAFTGCTSPANYSGLAAGSHTFQVRATDSVGNTDSTPASFTWTVDTIPPDTTITSGPAAVTNKMNASFKFSATEKESTFACSLDGGAFTACTSPSSYNALAPGNHTFQVRATDAASNTDPTPANFNWTIQ